MSFKSVTKVMAFPDYKMTLSYPTSERDLTSPLVSLCTLSVPVYAIRLFLHSDGQCSMSYQRWAEQLSSQQKLHSKSKSARCQSDRLLGSDVYAFSAAAVGCSQVFFCAVGSGDVKVQRQKYPYTWDTVMPFSKLRKNCHKRRTNLRQRKGKAV